VSSPKDVAPERGRVQAVTAKLNREYEGLIRFETVLWEEHFYTADKSFQPQISEAVASDIVVSIFWTRIGTELPDDFPRMPNGKPYPSGTAYELLTALEGSKAKGVPHVYVFRKTADATLPMADAELRRQAQTQLDALEAFWGEWFRSDCLCCWSISSRNCLPMGLVTQSARPLPRACASSSGLGGSGWWQRCAPISTSCCSNSRR
jgi:hypothetical protein